MSIDASELMSGGEKLIWAAVFAQHIARNAEGSNDAASFATLAIVRLRAVDGHEHRGVMMAIDDMRGTLYEAVDL